MNEMVRTRFAPSPTGYLHIGGARTALFNYLLARRLGGKFVLRIEDTDQTRNIERADRKLMEDLSWLGLNWDEGPEVGGPYGPYHQSERLQKYRDAARKLLDAGNAYYAFDTREELEAMRLEAGKQQAGKPGRSFRYPRPERFPSDADAQRARDAGRPVVVRLRMPEHEYVVRDQILGDVRIAASEVDDFVLLKADGWPTYHFAVVVDDEDMRVTHVLRGQEHLMNTPNHLGLQELLGCRTPVYAHLPIILNIDGAKMSKREKDRAVRAAAETLIRAGQADEATLMRHAGLTDAALFAAWLAGLTQIEGDALRRLARRLEVRLPEIEIHDFRLSGYLPEVLLNFIALLGWSAGEDREKLTLDEMCGLFSLDRVGKTNARFDRDKLLNFNTTALAAADAPRKLAALRDFLAQNEPSPLTTLDEALLRRLIEINEGVRTLRDVEDKCAVLFAPDEAVRFDEPAVAKVLRKGGGADVLRDILPALESCAEWAPAAIEAIVRGFGEQRGLSLGKVAQPLRVAVTGTTVSPPIFETLAILGRERTAQRVRRALAHLATPA